MSTEPARDDHPNTVSLIRSLSASEKLWLIILGTAALSAGAISAGYNLYGTVAIDGVGVVVNSVLSAALVLLYYQHSTIMREQRDINEQQANIMAEQKEIQDTQRSLQAIDQSPTIEVDDFEIDNDQITVTLSNLGRGPAEELKFIVEIDFEGCEWFEPEPVPVDLVRVNGGQRSIPPYASEKTFSASGQIRPAGDPNPHGHSFQGTMNDLVRDGVRRIELDLYVRSEGVLESEDCKPICDSLTVDLNHCSEPYSLEEVYEQSTPRVTGRQRAIVEAGQ